MKEINVTGMGEVKYEQNIFVESLKKALLEDESIDGR
jgi:cobalamin biosynthesis Co2+ chelatase CbiK